MVRSMVWSTGGEKKKQENTVYFVHVLHVYVVCCNQFYHKCVFFFLAFGLTLKLFAQL